MPSVVIEVKKNYSQQEECNIIDAVYEALVAAFGIKPNERTIRAFCASATQICA